MTLTQQRPPAPPAGGSGGSSASGGSSGAGGSSAQRRGKPRSTSALVAATGTVAGGMDTAFGPQTEPGGNFLAPVDIQTYPPIRPLVRDNTYDGTKTNPPY